MSAFEKSTGPVVVLLGYVTKHQEPQFREASRLIPRLKLLLSVMMESQRDYRPELDELDVTLQKTWTLAKRWKHETGFSDNIAVHFPYDTFFQLRKLRPSVIVSYELGIRSIFSALYRVLHRRSRLVLAVYVSEHTERSWSRSRILVRKVLLRCADIVTCQGSSGKRYLIGLGVPESKIKHIPYVAHPNMLYSGPTDREPGKRIRLLYVGQFTERKAPEQFLEILGKWCVEHPDRTVEISMVGRGPLQARLESMSHPTNLEVTMIGSVAPMQLPEIYGRHGIMVFPTLADEWGLVVEEALASGLPVLSSVYAQSTLDLIEEGKNGWRFAPDNLEETYQAVDRMLSTDHDRLNEMAAYGRASVAYRTPKFGGGEMAKAVEAAAST